MPFGLNSEASRETVVVNLNHVNLVEILMDVNQWSSMFAGIVTRGMTLEVLSTGVAGNCDGVVQVMITEFQDPSPLVPTHENYFVRYCKHHACGKMWAVVDVSLDDLRSDPVSQRRRRASGCLIQELPNGYSKVTWVDHVEVDDRDACDLYKRITNSGIAFGAECRVAALDRQSERLASATSTNIRLDIGVRMNQEGRKSMLKLAERMVISFYSGLDASTAHTWAALSGRGAVDIRVMPPKSMDDPSRPPGIVLSATGSFWIHVPPKRVFDFFRNENPRNEAYV